MEPSGSQLMQAIVVVELPALRNKTRRSSAPSTGAAANVPASASIAPKFVLVLPHGDPTKIPRNVLSFCFPDLNHLVKAPYHYEHTADEYVFTLTTKDQPRIHGFCRRYRVGTPSVGGRLDLTPFSSARDEDTSAPTYQCICILSERPYHRFFSQCLQLLHAARVAGGPTAMRLARTLLAFNAAAPGAIIPLRSLSNVLQIPGHMHFARERLRVPPDVGLPASDIPLAPLLSRLDAPALLALYVALLTERRIMLVSQSISTLTSCVHAALALLQPFPWPGILIPVLDTAFLPYCCAPNPYIIGTTPPQFVQLAEEYDGVGELVLVALDEGYVACLNSAQALVDLDGAVTSGSVTGMGPGAGPGTVTYAGPRLSADRATAKAGTSSVDSPTVTGRAAFGLGTEGGMHGPATAMGVMEINQASLNRREGAALAAATQGAVLGGMAAVESALSPFHNYSRSHAYDDEVVTARAYRRSYMHRRMLARRLAREKVQELFGREPGQVRSRRPSGSAPPPLSTMFSGGEGAGAGALDVELDGFWAEESGTVVLNVDLVGMVTKGGSGKDAPRRRAPMPVRPQLDSGSSSLARSLGLSKLTGKLAAFVTGGPASDCPGACLAHEVREVYGREKREGAFDESALTCALLAFVGVVFARLPEFVTPGANGALRFSKEEFVRASCGARFPVIGRLLEEVQHTQLLDSFACDLAAGLHARREAGGGVPVLGVGYGSGGGRLNVTELLFGEATSALAMAGVYSSAGSSSLATREGATGMGAAFATVQRRMGSALAGLTEPLTDCPKLGDGPGIAGTAHTASTALAGVAYSATCAVAVSYAPPPGTLPPYLAPAPMPLLVTALRGLLTAATSMNMLPEESPASVAKLACAASHDPVLLHVVLGVLWARMNDSNDKLWPQGVRALHMLASLLRSGSPRVHSLAVGFIPLLRFLMHPVRAAAVRAGYFAEDLGGKADACGYVQGANVVHRSRNRGLFGTATGPIPGVTLSTAPGVNALASTPLREGHGLLAKAAARCYVLLASPRRWLLERAIAAGPAAVSNGAPLAGPFPYPLIGVSAVSAPASASYPPGWLPTASQTVIPAPTQDVPMPEGSPPPYPPLQRQPRAADAPWEVVHRVAAPACASSRSHALARMAAQCGTVLSAVIVRPMHVHMAIAAMTAASGGMVPALADSPSAAEVHLSFLPMERRPASVAAACALPRRSYGGVPWSGEEDGTSSAPGRRQDGGGGAAPASTRPGLPLSQRTEREGREGAGRRPASRGPSPSPSSSSSGSLASLRTTTANTANGHSASSGDMLDLFAGVGAAQRKTGVGAGDGLMDLFGPPSAGPVARAPTVVAVLRSTPSAAPMPTPSAHAQPKVVAKADVNPFDVDFGSGGGKPQPAANKAAVGFDFDSWAAPIPASQTASNPAQLFGLQGADLSFSFDNFGPSSSTSGVSSGAAGAGRLSGTGARPGDPFAF